ncbi:O-antigen ligase-like membrane protein [Flavobacterium lacus]|uniref:O-antigen ligase-like membrane protein n=1 Tax=Flavobacterium lacus TaxID=1353778 RepID=A0A328WMV7_9FLAO|nr:O-antigen ligase-like membrane protein [Flavobacterium lacus]
MSIISNKESTINTLPPKANFFYVVRNNAYFMLVSLMIFSYFYNLPIIGYSVKGDNELRLYDLLGLIVLTLFYGNYKFYYYVIQKVNPLKWLYWFILWSTFTIISTLLFAIFMDKMSVFYQSVLYLYHLWIFFVTSVLLYVISFDRYKLKLFVIIVFSLSSISCIIIALQNFNLIPFLWSDNYYKGYRGFLSGTLGPNKIVTGMFSLINFIFAIGVFFNKKLNISKVFTVFVIVVNIYVLLLSGSRTSYLGLLIFILFFSFYKTSSFIFFGLIVGSLFGFLLTSNNNLYEKVEEVISGRVINKIENDEDIENANVGELYQDLGAGRDRLSINYLNYILENPEIIPFGLGFNNRTTKSFSAHNMYLNVIKELGLVGFYFYFGWLINYLLISFKKNKGEALALKGLVFSMLVTLFFGEHLYIYRPLFAILGIFLVVVNLLISSLHENETITSK